MSDQLRLDAGSPPAAAASRRDVARERAFLREAGRDREPFVEHAEARLARGEETYGDSWAWIGIRRHLTELLEEAADLGAWASLATQALEGERDLSELHRVQIGAVLVIAARHGAQAHAALSNALRSIG
jgi:hypothetical protein